MTFHNAAATAVPLLTVIVSLIAVYKTADWVVTSATRIADVFHMGTFAVGALFVSVSTSLPELFVGVIAAFRGSGGLALGNVIGSNIANITLLLGLAVLIGGVLTSKRDDIRELTGILFITSAIPIILFGRGSIGLYAALTLLLIFFAFSFKLVNNPSPNGGQEKPVASRGEKWKAVGLFAGAVTLLLVSTDFFVQGASVLARTYGLTEEFIGLTIVAIGTSLPELSVAVNGMKRKEYNVVLGNLIGSNIANITLVLGSVAAINAFNGFTVSNFTVLASALPYLLLSTLYVWYRLSNKESLTRGDAVILLGLYAAFLAQELGILFLL